MGKTIAVQDANSTATVLENHTGGLKAAALELLGNKDLVLFGQGTVSGFGFEFFENGNPETVWVPPHVDPSVVYTSLVARGVYDTAPAYRAHVPGYISPVTVSHYHTRRVFGDAPKLDLNQRIEIHAVRTPKGGVSFVYKV